jgi:UrcA family protein
MSSFVTARTVGSGAKFALLMLTGALSCGLAVGAARAATVDSNVPTLVVHYTTESLATDSGVKALYRRLVHAAEQVCPQSDGTRFVSSVARACRQEAIARAVEQVNNPHLAALYATSSKNG